MSARSSTLLEGIPQTWHNLTRMSHFNPDVSQFNPDVSQFNRKIVTPGTCSYRPLSGTRVESSSCQAQAILLVGTYTPLYLPSLLTPAAIREMIGSTHLCLLDKLNASLCRDGAATSPTNAQKAAWGIGLAHDRPHFEQSGTWGVIGSNYHFKHPFHD